MNGYKVITARIYIKRTDEREELMKIEQANRELSKYGINISCGQWRKQDNKTFLACALSITINNDSLSRGAGRRASETSYTLAEIESMIADHLTAEDIATRAGLSIASYYRHLRKAREREQAGEQPETISF